MNLLKDNGTTYSKSGDEINQDHISTKPPPPPKRRMPSGAELNDAQYRSLLRWHEAELQHRRRLTSPETPDAKKVPKA